MVASLQIPRRSVQLWTFRHLNQKRNYGGSWGLLITSLNFRQNLAEYTPCLRALLGKSSGWWWDTKMEEEFNKVKSLLTSPPVLAPFDMHSDITLSTDASSFGLGAAILQKHGVIWRPVAYASRAMMVTEQLYAKEALAICWSADMFHYFLAGRIISHYTQCSAQ